jgi:hypothetical protein
MTKGKKTTERFEKRINIRMSATDWHEVMLRAQEDRQTPSAWLRVQIGKILNGLRRKAG